MARTDIDEMRRGRSQEGLYETVKVVIEALLIVLVVRTVLFQPFNIPSGSLIPTLLVGDYLFVSKYAYGYSRHALPYSPPIFKGRIFASEPERGDIAVFKLPKDGSTDYIKRVMGLPGDRIRVVEGIVHINDVPVTRERIEDFRVRDKFGGEVLAPQYVETLPNGVRHRIIEVQGDTGHWDNAPRDAHEYRVPPGYLFMMGDNRDDSTDSRDEVQVGMVPFENLVGRAEIIFFSIDETGSGWKVWEWPWTVRWKRILSTVR